MADEIIDIIHNIQYQVQDQELQKAVRTVEGNLSGIENLTKRQIRLAQQYSKTSATDEKSREKINRLIRQNTSALNFHKKSLEDNVFSNRKLNKAMEQELGIIGTIEKKLRVLQTARKSATSMEDIRRYDSMIRQQQTKLNSLNNVPNNSRGFSMGGIMGGTFARMLPAVGGALALGNISSQIKEVTQKFESYRTVLRNTFQSSIKANEEFEKIREFAEKTPYGVDELMSSFVKLVNRGFVPTREELTNLGDLAASQGKSFNQLTEAILDAQTGEFERLKEFGIRARTTGDMVTLSFKGIEKQVKKTDEQALRNAVISFGRLQGVAGGMAAQATTLSGKISNLGDSMDALFSSIGNRGSGAFGSLIDGAKELVDWFNELIAKNPADTFREQQTELNNLVGQLIIANNQEEIRSSLMSEIAAKYPEFLSLIDAEKSSTEQLASALNILNQEYENKIRLALISDEQNKITEKQTDLIRKQREAIKALLPELEKYGMTEVDFSRLSPAEQQRVGNEIFQKLVDERGQKAIDQITTIGKEWSGNAATQQTNQAVEFRNNFQRFEAANKALNEERIRQIELSNAQQESYISGLKESLTKEEEELRIMKESGAKQEEIEAQMKLIQGIKDRINPPTPTAKETGESTTKNTGKKTDPNAEALKRLDDQMKAEQEKQKQHFEKQKSLLQQAFDDQIIDRETYNRQVQNLTDELNFNLLKIEGEYSIKRLQFLKGSEKEAAHTRKLEIENSLREITDAIRKRSEQIIDELIKGQKEIDDKTFQLLADNQQKEIKNLERSTDDQLKSISEQFEKLNTLKINALSDINSDDPNRHLLGEKEMQQIVQSQKALEDYRLKVVEDFLIKERDIRLKYALIEINELQSIATNRVEAYTLVEQKRFDEKFEQELESNDQTLKNLRDSIAEQIDETELSNRKKKEIEEKRAKDSEEIAIRSEIAKLHILKTSIQNQLSVLRAGFDQLTDEERESRTKQILVLQAQLGITQNNIQGAFTQLNEIGNQGTEGVNSWTNSFQQLSDTATMAAQSIVQAMQYATDQEISIRERRVDRVKQIAERGNAELLQMEEERLQKAQAQQERHARAQIAINAAQQVSASLVAIANAASAGYGWASIPLVLAVIGALASGFAMVRSMSQDSTAGFKDGVVDLRGPGTPTSDSIPARLSRGESVVTAAGTKAGDNAEILRMMNNGHSFNLPNLHPHSPEAKFIDKTSQNIATKKLEQKLDSLIEVTGSKKPSTITIDEDGVAAISDAVKIRKRKRNKL